MVVEADVVVVGLGPAGPEYITDQARSLLTGNDAVWLRTSRHAGAAVAPGASSFDDVYDNAETIENVYETIVERLVASAKEGGRVVYAVPGSPLVAEHTVELLRANPYVSVEVVPALSFLDLIWARLGIDPLAAAPRVVDGQRFAADAAGQTGALVVAQCDSVAVLSSIKLAYEDVTPGEVVVLQRLGLPDEHIETIKWEDLDRVVEPDHLTSLWIPNVGVPVARDLERLHEVARELREACPWDREQTHESLARYAIEETYELVDAIELRAESSDPQDDHLIEELGDVFFQVFAHAAIAEQEGRFNISDIAREVTEKLIERHPHVYGDVIAETADDVKATWESNKMTRKGRTSVLEGIPRNLPALMFATKVLKKAANSQVDLNVEDVEASGLGAALLVMVDEARKRGEDPEAALRHAVDTYMDAFKKLENEERAPEGD